MSGLSTIVEKLKEQGNPLLSNPNRDYTASYLLAKRTEFHTLKLEFFRIFKNLQVSEQKVYEPLATPNTKNWNWSFSIKPKQSKKRWIAHF